MNRDEAVIASIESFTPHRNELIELFIVIAQYAGTAETRQKIHRFFESLTSFLEPIQGREEVESDNFRFIVHELFISLIAVLLRYERFEFAAHMMSTPYLRKRPNASPTVETFECFRNYLRALQTRNGDWSYDDFPYIPICLSNDKGTPLTDKDLYQADFTLFLRPCFDVLNNVGEQ